MIVIELKGLHCPNCANKIEQEIQKIKGINFANINFANQIMLIKLDSSTTIENILKQITTIVNSHESQVTVRLKDKSTENDVHNDEIKFKFLRFGIGLVIFIIAIFLNIPFMKLTAFLIAYIIFGFDVVITALKNILKGDFFDENFLMTIATFGAFILGEYPEAVAVMLFYQIGEILNDIAVNRSRKSIRAIMDIRPDSAHKILMDKVETVNPADILIGDFILVKPGERVPLDGIIEEGTSQLDTKALTGESVPRIVNKGDEVLSGCINQSGLLKIKVTKLFSESTVTKILELVENASARKAPTEKFITKFAKLYTPIVVFIALAVAIVPPIITNTDFSIWFSRALIMLVISCPCALVVSVPLSFFSGIGTASSKGILIKGSNYLQALNLVSTVVFDKTGTLTEGVFEVIEIKPENNISSEELLKYTAIAECHSTHPIAKSILNKYNLANEINIKNYEEIAGMGIKVLTEENVILSGNYKLMQKENINIEKVNSSSTIVYTAVNNKYLGYIVIADKLKSDSKTTIKNLNNLNIDTIMLTGDRDTTAKTVANELNINKYYSELLPAQKVERLEEINSKGKIIFVGDGINDAPVLARADIGCAMGGAGSDATIEVADIVIMNDEPSKIVEAIKIAKHTNKIVWQNIIFALSVKFLVLILGGLGFANMWLAVFADVGVTLLAVINSMRKQK